MLGPNSYLTYSRGGGLLPAKRTTIHVTTGADGAVTSCLVREPGDAWLARLLPKPCADDELVLLPPISPLALTFLPIYNAYPLIDGDVGERPGAGLVCYG